MNKHTIKYHGDNGLTTVPTSLRKVSARPQQDRLCFSLKESSSVRGYRSFHAAEKDQVMKDFDVPIDPASKIQNPRPSLDEDQEDYLIKCVCGFDDDDGNTVLCYLCKKWQHIQCYYIDEPGKIPDIGAITHFCVDCKPRPLDARAATDRQMKRKEKERQESPQWDTSGEPATSGYWSRVEQEKLRTLIRRYGSNWEAIANNMKGKTRIMVWKFAFSIECITK